MRVIRTTTDISCDDFEFTMFFKSYKTHLISYICIARMYSLGPHVDKDISIEFAIENMEVVMEGLHVSLSRSLLAVSNFFYTKENNAFWRL